MRLIAGGGRLCSLKQRTSSEGGTGEIGSVASCLLRGVNAVCVGRGPFYLLIADDITGLVNQLCGFLLTSAYINNVAWKMVLS